MFFRAIAFISALTVSLTFGVSTMAAPLVTPLQQAVAEAASQNDAIATFYRSREFEPVWIGEGARDRREAFLWALDQAQVHGLPTYRYNAVTIRQEFAGARNAEARGTLDVAMTQRFLQYAQDVSSGVLDPRKIDPTIVIDVPKRDWITQMTTFTDGDPYAFVKALWPTSPNYRRLLREKLRLEEMRLTGGWGDAVSGGTLSKGSDGQAVIDLRNRLIRMGYLKRSAISVFDPEMEAAIRAFQIDHGLNPDGEAGEATLAAVNATLDDRIGQIIVGLERQRWMNKPFESRHILVNLAEQHAYVYDDGKVTFDTVVVVGADTPDRRTPEFSDTMTHIVINPYWHVPRSIAVGEYLPALKRGGARHLEVYSRNERVNPNNIDFNRYNASNFPFSLKQAPGPRNALGRVKFMFPNIYNIYLHDTPSRSLFTRDVRTFSHGCVRVEKPLELAYHLLAPQSEDPEALFTGYLRSGRETRVNLEEPVGVHIVYWSAWVTATGRANYRSDPYGRDVKVLRGLQDAGVEMAASRS